MFEERLRVILIVFLACWMIVVLRLFQLQVIRADHFQEQAEARLLRTTKVLQPIRGRILDREHRVLASDEPAWSVALHYRLLIEDPAYHQWLADEIRERREWLRRLAAGTEPAPQLRPQINGSWVADRIDDLWRDLARQFSDGRVGPLKDEVREIVLQVQRWKEGYVTRHQLSEPQARRAQIQEEQVCHAVLQQLDQRQHIDAQHLLAGRYFWLLELGAVEISDSSVRTYHGGQSLAHVIGQMREVRSADLERRAYRRNGRIVDRGGYQSRDHTGEGGVEQLCESRLRGQRGWLRTYYDDRPESRVEPVHGQDVRLTLDFELQQELYALLEHRVTEVTDRHMRQAGFSSSVSPAGGGSVVVLHVPTRDVLALVSYPGYDPNRYHELVAELSRDVRRFPLHFRAVYSQYEPGSIMKPVTIAAALATGIIGEQDTLDCQGKLFPNNPRSGFRCWRPAGSSQPVRHGPITAEQAIKYSCNVFCFNLGNLFCTTSGSSQMGVQRLCEWFDLFGVGRRTGIGLARETAGILATPSYLAMKGDGRAVRVGDARNNSIGQGDLQVTPLQAANIAATYASGEYRAVSLLQDQRHRSGWRLPVSDAIWGVVRRGMYRVVNEAGGTARLYAGFEHPEFALCGKSGSAQKPRWITDYRVVYLEGDSRASAVVQASNQAGARLEFLRLHRQRTADHIIELTPAGHWPPHAEKDPSHAWFVAFLQPKARSGQPDWNRPAPVAIAALLEFGGSGGRAAGPLCRDVAALIADRFPQYTRAGLDLALTQP